MNLPNYMEALKDPLLCYTNFQPTFELACTIYTSYEKHWLTTNETGVVEHVLFLVLLSSEVCKGVDDHAKDEVLNDDDDDQEEEGEIVHNTQDE